MAANISAKLEAGKLMIDSGYFQDMKIVDERLTKLEEDVENLTEFIKDLIGEIRLIIEKEA